MLQYVYNDRRQLELERVTTLGGATDGHVRSIEREHDDLGRMFRVTSHGDVAASDTMIRNQVKLTYNELDQITVSEQSHEDDADGFKPKVQYAYDPDSSSSVFTRGHRQNKVTYPNGREVFYDYDTGNSSYPANRLSRIHSIRDTNSSGTEWAKYSYAGASRLASAEYPISMNAIQLDYTSSTTGQYPGLDRFGRVQDQRWKNASADVDRFKYLYDFAGNRSYRQNALTTLKDQLFDYDGLHRLKNSKQGTLDLMGAPAITGTPATEQDWTLDTLGNWSKFTIKAGVDTTLDQTRDVNEVNEITNITNSVGMGWVTPEYDAAGNATKLPYPAIPTQLTTHIYDAWNRLVEVKFGTTITLERYEYDGLGRRIVRTIFPSTTNDVQHSYYNENWQELEVRKEISGTESQNPYEQFIWHPYYIDALATRFYDDDVSDPTGVVQHYFTHDANFNVTAALDTSGTVAERYDYTPYGKVTFLDANFTPLSTQASTIANSYLYTGRHLDATTGLYYYRNRYYIPEIGIFTSRDPIGYWGLDGNLYRYTWNQPLDFTDPYGHIPPAIVTAAIAPCILGAITGFGSDAAFQFALCCYKQVGWKCWKCDVTLCKYDPCSGVLSAGIGCISAYWMGPKPTTVSGLVFILKKMGANALAKQLAKLGCP